MPCVLQVFGREVSSSNEQGVYLDGHPGTGERQPGTETLLTNLERALR
jgi:hypothetical protein